MGLFTKYFIVTVLLCTLTASTLSESTSTTKDIKLPEKVSNFQTFQRENLKDLIRVKREDDDDDDDDDDDYDLGTGRLLSADAFSKISETLGALNTVGRYIVNMTKGQEVSNQQGENVPNAILTLTKRVLGQNLTNSIEPLIKRVGGTEVELSPETSEATQVQDTDKEINIENKKKKKQKIKRKDEDTKKTDKVTTANKIQETVKDTSSENNCRTPDGRPGKCEDLSTCPGLLLDLTHLRESLCFKRLFVPGVCCPSQTSTILTTQKPVILTTKRPPSTTPSTTVQSLILAPVTESPTTTKRPFVPVFTISQPQNISATLTSVGSLDMDSNGIVSEDDCGQREYSSGRIVGGEVARTGDWPWMAAIFLHGPKRTEFWCGGSLIGNKYVLTAAHCTRDSRQRPFAARQFTVRLGDIDLSTDKEPSAPATYKVTEVRAHEKFSRVGFYNDIAIMVLERPVRKSKYVIPVCLPKPTLPPKERLARSQATVVGWGTTYYGGKESTVQRQAVLPIWRNEDCNRAYFQPITDNFLCAGYSDGGVDACQGDSGGPLMMSVDTRWTQIGVVSFGNKCGEPGYPGVYTRISEYMEWIRQNTKE